jgi:hypothetical protein
MTADRLVDGICAFNVGSASQPRSCGIARSLTVQIRFATFADWWEPFTLGVGPAGAYVSQLGHAQRQAVRARCAQLLPSAPFHICATAWTVRAQA